MSIKPAPEDQSQRKPQKRPLNTTHHQYANKHICVFDFFLDIPHPGASKKNERARIIEPPGIPNPGVAEINEAENISRIAMFAFPDYDGDEDVVEESQGGILNKYDVDFTGCTSFYHTFSLLLDSGLHIHAHVMRYLPIHPGVKNRLDVGRRAERAMIIITRAVGGERFYASLLKCLQGISMEEMVTAGLQNKNSTNVNGSQDDSDLDLIKLVLHAVFKRHFLLKARCDAAMEKGKMTVLEAEFKTIILNGAEIYRLSFHDEGGGGNRLFMEKDTISLQLPLSLQPGYDSNDSPFDGDYLDSPILPLLRCLGPGKTIRVLSAVLCEVQVIFVSKYVDTMSSCMRATMAMLSQGLLVWRHVCIPSLPPHLFRFLSAGAPYIVGVLHRYAERIDRVKGLKDVLSINLDSGTLKTYKWRPLFLKVPDILETSAKSSKKQRDYIGTEMLAKDFADILELDRKIWGKRKDDENPGLTEGPEPTKIASEIVANAKKGNSFHSLGLRGSLNKDTRGASQMSLTSDMEDSNNKHDQFFDAAAVFVETITGNDEKEGTNAATLSVNNMKSKSDNIENQTQLPSKPVTKRPHSFCESEQGEEMLRASLICFFLEIFGDMGLYLLVSRSTGTLKVDRKKFLLRKCQMGVTEKSPLWYTLKQFSRSKMFERFVQCSIKETEQEKTKRKVLVDHVPLFSLCQKHLRKAKSNFCTAEVRRVVYTTIEGCPNHQVVERLEKNRDLALALTAEKPYEGNEVKEVKKLLEECKHCNLTFAQVMAVVWLRIGDSKSSHWKHVILGLHLLRNLILHGPIMSVSSAVDGIPEIFLLQFYQSKIVEAERSTQLAASQIFELLKDIGGIFARRRKGLAGKVQTGKLQNENSKWANYLIRRLPIDVKFRHLHVMFIPDEAMKPMSGGHDRRTSRETRAAGGNETRSREKNYYNDDESNGNRHSSQRERGGSFEEIRFG